MASCHIAWIRELLRALLLGALGPGVLKGFPFLDEGPDAGTFDPPFRQRVEGLGTEEGFLGLKKLAPLFHHRLLLLLCREMVGRDVGLLVQFELGGAARRAADWWVRRRVAGACDLPGVGRALRPLFRLASPA